MLCTRRRLTVSYSIMSRGHGVVNARSGLTSGPPPSKYAGRSVIMDTTLSKLKIYTGFIGT